MPAELEVDHDEAASRYILRRGDTAVGMLGYRRDGDVVETFTTQIFPAGRGQGLGTVLVRHVLDDLRSRGDTVIPTCWFVADFLAAHDDYADLRA